MRSIALCLVLVCSMMTNVWCQEMLCLKYFTPGDNVQKRARSVAISPGGEYVVIADEGSRLKVWNATNGSIVATIGENAYISAVAFTPDGRRVVLGAIDGSITLWDAVTWKKVGLWEEHPSSVFSIHFSPNGKQAATGGMDGSVALRNASTGHIDASLSPHNQAINGLAFDGKRSHLISASLDEIRVWDSASGKQISSLTHAGSQNGATALVISPKGDWVAAGCPEKNSISLWNLEDNTLVQQLAGHTDEVTALQFSRDGKKLYSASMDGSIRTWEVHTGDAISTRKAHAGGATSICAAIKVDRIVTGGSEGEAVIHEEGNRTLGILRSHMSQLNGVNYEVDGKHISAHVETSARSPVWRLWPVQETAMVDEPMQDSRLSLVWHAAIAPNGAIRARTFRGSAAIALKDGDQSWQSDTWRETEGGAIVGIWISATGQSIVAAAHKFIYLWDTNDTSSQAVIPIQADHISNFTVSPDGKVAVVGGATGLIEAFDLTTNEPLWNKQASVLLEKGKQMRPNHINGLRFVDDHTLALLADDCLQIWDTRSGTMLFAKPQTKEVDLRVLASSTDGLFATGGYEMRAVAKRTVKQWVVKLWKLNDDGKSVRLISEAVTGDYEIRHVCFAPDNSSIATTDSGGWLRIWECSNPSKSTKP